MNNQEIAKRKQALDALYSKVSKLTDDLELQSHWARYLCVLTSGFMEQSIRTIFAEYARRQAGPHVGNYVSDQLRAFQNAKMEKIFGLVRQFNPAWEEEVRSATSDDVRDAVDSIIARRHEIAHGMNSGISFHQMRDYYNRAVKIIEILEKQCTGIKSKSI